MKNITKKALLTLCLPILFFISSCTDKGQSSTQSSTDKTLSSASDAPKDTAIYAPMTGILLNLSDNYISNVVVPKCNPSSLTTYLGKRRILSDLAGYDVKYFTQVVDKYNATNPQTEVAVCPCPKPCSPTQQPTCCPCQSALTAQVDGYLVTKNTNISIQDSLGRVILATDSTQTLMGEKIMKLKTQSDTIFRKNGRVIRTTYTPKGKELRDTFLIIVNQ